ncbi:MAG: outer membrane lipoprotein-sorting protein [Alphaproteobacteria bacterium]|nr:outer membrane lipoprotein-sorting protein [Alphaproteobacteria bacterium]
MISFKHTFVLAGLLASPSPASASDTLTGDMIADHMQARAEGQAVERTLHMTLADKKGRIRERTATVLRRQNGDQKETVIRFTEPRSVKGMAFLTHDRVDPALEDEQWLYLAAVRKVRRIPASDRGDYFLGTDFTYNDVKEELKFEPQDYIFKFESSYMEAGKQFHRISGTPSSDTTAKELGYGAFKAVVAAESWMPVDIEFFDIGGKPLKHITVQDVRLVDGIWSPRKIGVTNLQTGHSTQFTYSDIDYSVTLTDADFSASGLKSGRGR